MFKCLNQQLSGNMTWQKTHIQTDTAFYILGYKYICVSSGVHVSSVPSDLRPVAGPGRSQGIWDSEPAPAPSLAALTLIEAKRFGLSRNFLVFLTLGSETQLSCTRHTTTTLTDNSPHHSAESWCWDKDSDYHFVYKESADRGPQKRARGALIVGTGDLSTAS